MGFLDDVKGSFNRGAAAANRATEKMKAKNQLSTLLKRRKEVLSQLGANLYEVTKNNPEFTIGRENLYNEILQIDGQRNQLIDYIESLEQEAYNEQQLAQNYTCYECGSTVSASDAYCMGCGKQVSDIVEYYNAQSYEDDFVESDISCPNCGEPVGEDDVFCMSCGNKLK
ncbi:MAG: zinc ribbon domain-containing protein [Coriobacteriia bacterium]|nr:zinc ribbon domain-containing protein [Coriobacteriia bacterium]